MIFMGAHYRSLFVGETCITANTIHTLHQWILGTKIFFQQESIQSIKHVSLPGYTSIQKMTNLSKGVCRRGSTKRHLKVFESVHKPSHKYQSFSDFCNVNEPARGIYLSHFSHLCYLNIIDFDQLYPYILLRHINFPATYPWENVWTF